MSPRPPADDEKEFFTEAFWEGDAAADVSTAKDGGILKRVLTAGTEGDRPTKGTKVFVDYRGWNFVDASMFDESRKPDGGGEEFSFDLGKGMVIRGWDEGVATMNIGEVSVYKLAPAYAYGVGGSPPNIPANSVLIFKVTLHSFTGEDISPKSNKTIERLVLREGEAYLMPADNNNVIVDVVGTITEDGTEFMREENLTFLIGECTEAGLPPGVDKAIIRMTKGEESKLIMKDEWTYGEDNKVDKVAAGQSVTLQINLRSFEKEKQSWDMNVTEKLDKADEAKAKGTSFFKEGKYHLALRRYKQIDSLLQFEQSSGKEEEDGRRKALLLSGHLNEAMTYLKTNDPAEAIKQCTMALKEEEGNVKALYRRAMGYQQIKEYQKAVVDLEGVLATEAGNAAARSKLTECKHELSEEHRKEKAMYAKMFGA